MHKNDKRGTIAALRACDYCGECATCGALEDRRESSAMLAEFLGQLAVGAWGAAAESRDHGHEAQANRFGDAASQTQEIIRRLTEEPFLYSLSEAEADGLLHLPPDGTLRR